MTSVPDPASASGRPTGQRLHPASILFDSMRYIRNFALPAIFAMFSASRASGGEGPFRYNVPDVDLWLPLLVIPALFLSVARYWSFRLRYDDDELTIRSGLVFRNERRIPFARIQNLDAVQNVFHRLLSVVEIRVETGSGAKAEARISVLPVSALDEMRARVFNGRAAPRAADAAGATEATGATTGAADAHGSRVVLHLPVRELLLCGFLENKGMVLVAAAYGVLLEAGLLNRLWESLFAVNVDVRGLMRDVVAAASGGAPVPAGRLVLAGVAVAGFFLVVRILSMVWAFVRLYDFRLSRVGDDLRVEYGLFTKVAATIPIHRVQTLTIEEGWLHRRLERASVRVETAGGQTGAATRDREWVAPLVHRSALGPLLADVLPGVDVDRTDWQPVHPRAFRRAIKPALVLAIFGSLVLILFVGPRGLVIVIPVVAWAVFATRRRVACLGWLASDSVVRFRSGWITRRRTVARVSKIQAVATRQSPLDRRAGMASVRVDTAGASERSHRIDIPYLADGVAQDLCHLLASRAAQTEFRW
jgi:putative membrane protein